MVVGSGMMGSGIGAMSALAGNRTILVDVDESHVRSGMEKAMACIDLRVGNGLNTAEEAEEAKKRMETSIDMLKAAASARMIIEAVVEQLEVKQALFEKLDEVLPVEVPICSNTSGLRITDISGTCKKPERTVTTHFWLPAHLVPLVEVVMGEKTERVVAEGVRDELKKWKKSSVLYSGICRASWQTVCSRPLSGNRLPLSPPVWPALRMWIRQSAVGWQCVFRSGGH